MTTAIMVLRFLAFASGVLFLGAAYLVRYDSEEQVIQNTIEKWWVNLDDGRGSVHEWLVSFARTSATISNRLLDKAWGPFQLSSRAILVSLYLSVVSYAVAEWMFFDGEVFLEIELERISEVNHIVNIAGRMAAFIVIPLCLVAAIALTFHHLPDAGRPRHKFNFKLAPWTWVLVGSTLFLGLIYLDEISIHPVIFLAFLVSCLCDFVSIYVTRFCLQKLRNSQSIYGVLKFLTLDAVVMLSMILIPFSLLQDPIYGYLSDDFMVGSVVLANLNISNIVPSLLLFVAALLLITNYIFWEVLLRSTYDLANENIFKHRKLFAFVGFSLLLLSTSADPSAIQNRLREMADKVLN